MKKIFYLFLTLVSFVGLQGCSDDDGGNMDDMDPVALNSKTYTLQSVAVPEISGTATFSENTDGSVTIDLDLQNTPAGGQHPAHIHFNTAVEGGGIALTLGTVNGDTGESSITTTELDDGTPITYEALLDFDGYINVHLSADELSTLVAQGDIGQNELTGLTKAYDLGAVAVPDISGTATFSERVNGEALATIALENTPDGGEHPGHIHFNTAAEGGGIAFTFNPVVGDTGLSLTNVAALDDGTPFGYSDVISFNGYINIHLSADDLATLVAQGDIGQNELTGVSVSYQLDEKDVAGISGTALFEERLNGTTLVTLQLSGTPEGGLHPAHIHENDIATTGPIIVGLNAVNGDTGISKTQVSELVGGAAVTYDDLLTINAYINVHLSEEDLATIVAQGNIGANSSAGSQAESKTYDVVNSGATAYIFDGEELTNASNPDLTLKRGSTYTFNVTAAGHPFLIKEVQGTGTANLYNNGVTNNGAVNGSVTFTVPNDAPDILYYNCEFHVVMTGTFTIVD
ncbi:CHRD domain-containing protein [Robiginitalea sp. IMCC43444]|uniref:CHRD domain-containing protein n=1 Tax=Robiginitalea sp. IMCC43444 TaxID=3459121 RepID=UPI004043026E